MRWLWRIGGVLVLVVAAALGWLVWSLQQHPDLAVYDAHRWRAGPAPAASLKVTFLGVATVLLDDGKTALMTDGFFSRPDKLTAFLGQVQPDVAAIQRGIARTKVGQRLAAVVPLHSHYDHAMDAPEVARLTGATLLGSSSTLNIGRGWGLPESQMRELQLGKPLRFGRFTVTAYPAVHTPTGFTGGEITAPLKPPARATDYLEGQSYALHVEHDGRTLLITGTAGFVPGALQGVKAEVVLLGIGALGPRSDAQRDGYWREVVAATGARRVLPIHWDDFWLPADQPVKAMPPPLDKVPVSLDFLLARGQAEGVEVRLPPLWEPMDVFAATARR